MSYCTDVGVIYFWGRIYVTELRSVIYFLINSIAGEECTQEKMDNCYKEFPSTANLPDNTDDEIKARYNAICE